MKPHYKLTLSGERILLCYRYVPEYFWPMPYIHRPVGRFTYE